MSLRGSLAGALGKAGGIFDEPARCTHMTHISGDADEESKDTSALARRMSRPPAQELPPAPRAVPFSRVGRRRSQGGIPLRVYFPAPKMSAPLKKYTQAAGQKQDFSGRLVVSYFVVSCKRRIGRTQRRPGDTCG